MIKHQFCVFDNRPQIEATWCKGFKKFMNSCVLEPNTNIKDSNAIQKP